MNQETTTSNYTVTIPLSKKDILFRLFNEGHITFDELWLLAQDTVVNNYISQPVYTPAYPVTFPLPTPIYTTSGTAGTTHQSIH